MREVNERETWATGDLGEREIEKHLCKFRFSSPLLSFLLFEYSSFDGLFLPPFSCFRYLFSPHCRHPFRILFSFSWTCIRNDLFIPLSVRGFNSLVMSSPFLLLRLLSRLLRLDFLLLDVARRDWCFFGTCLDRCRYGYLYISLIALQSWSPFCLLDFR